MVQTTELKVLLMKLHDRHGFTYGELRGLLPWLSLRQVRRWVRQGRRGYEERGVGRLIEALLVRD
jgi:hypothetical protein